jgi:hypothetical protein
LKKIFSKQIEYVVARWDLLLVGIFVPELKSSSNKIVHDETFLLSFFSPFLECVAGANRLRPTIQIDARHRPHAVQLPK